MHESASASASASASNRLGSEASLYLQQHAHNPVDWYPWGEEALQRARAEDKPLFVSSGYSSCHWCHVMAHEVFEQADAAEVLNTHYVCIKLDREERPDLDAVLMQALQAMRGQGGWPLNLFLTPELKPFFGATYVPHGQFILLCAELARAWRERRGEIEAVGTQLAQLVSASATGKAAAGIPSEAVLDTVAQQLYRNFDQRWGGMNSQMKFPMPLLWSFVLHRYRRTGEARLELMLRTTLGAIVSGGIHDQLGGGFHRYTVENTWLIPHFEKMLYDNAQLASLLLEAGMVLNEPRFTAAGRATLDFMLSEMQTPEGGLCASFDADSGGEEGSYYVWTPQELAQVAGDTDGAALAVLLGVTSAGNFERRCVLTRRLDPDQALKRTGRSLDELEALLEKWRPQLRQFRSLRTAPARDDKVVTAWNGLALSALAHGAAVLDERRYLDAAAACAEYLWSVQRQPDGSLLRASTGGQGGSPGILDDYALLANGLLDLHFASGEILYAERALELLEYVEAHFANADGGYFLSAADVTAPLGRQVEIHDNVEPSGNAVLAVALAKAGALTGRAEYTDRAAALLARYAPLVETDGLEMAGWCDALQSWHGPWRAVTIAGALAHPRTQELLQAVRSGLPPHAVLHAAGGYGTGPELLELLPEPEGIPNSIDQPQAVVCEHGACKAPVSTAAELRTLLMAGWLY